MLLVLQVSAANHKETFENEIKTQWENLNNGESYENPEKIVRDKDAQDESKIIENCEKVKISVLKAAIEAHKRIIKDNIDALRELAKTHEKELEKKLEKEVLKDLEKELENLGIVSEKKQKEFEDEIKKQWMEVQKEETKIHYDLTNLQDLINPYTFENCAKKVHENISNSVYESHAKLMGEDVKKSDVIKEIVKLYESATNKKGAEVIESKEAQRLKKALESLQKIAKENDEKESVALEEAKESVALEEATKIATEMEKLETERASEKCYRTTAIILIVSIAIGVLAYLFMRYVSNEPEEKTEDQSDEQSYDQIDELKVSKEVQDTNNLITNEAEKDHVVINVKE